MLVSFKVSPGVSLTACNNRLKVVVLMPVFFMTVFFHSVQVMDSVAMAARRSFEEKVGVLDIGVFSFLGFRLVSLTITGASHFTTIGSKGLNSLKVDSIT